ncbi:MAG: host attachment protein [Caulobacterales bacterium]
MAHGTLFIIADGAHARLVARSPDTGDFVTLRELDGSRDLDILRAELRASPAGRSQNSTSASRSAVGPVESFRDAKEHFVCAVADLAAEHFADRAPNGMVVVAPARLIGVMLERLEGRVEITGRLAKDLTKVPNHELAAWLAKFETPVRA